MTQPKEVTLNESVNELRRSAFEFGFRIALLLIAEGREWNSFKAKEIAEIACENIKPVV